MVGDDVVFEILLKLPVTSIVRFRCVCRHWYDVIESREFKEQHYTLQNKSPLLAVKYDSDAAKIFSGKCLRVTENLRMPVWSSYVAGPCRGLFLLISSRPSRRANLGLLNPTTRAFRLLPRMPNAIPNSMYFTYGFGWDPNTNDYKVVLYLYLDQVGAVYSLNSDSWRLLDSRPPKLSTRCILSDMECVHTNGFCHWLLYGNTSLVSFNVAQENFVTITLPPNVNVINNAHTVISTYYDSLAFLAWEKERKVMEVWVLTQEQQHYWTKVYSFRQIDPTIRAMGIWNNTHVLLNKYGGSRGIFAYDMKYDNYEEKIKSIEELFAYDMKKNHYEEKVKSLDYIMYFLNYKKSIFGPRRE